MKKALHYWLSICVQRHLFLQWDREIVQKPLIRMRR